MFNDIKLICCIVRLSEAKLRVIVGVDFWFFFVMFVGCVESGGFLLLLGILLAVIF